jgi:methylglutaconyl-CoA hydratase
LKAPDLTGTQEKSDSEMPMYEGYETISVAMDGSTRVATISLNRPDQRNALSPMLVDELADAVAWADADDRVGAILLRGEGNDFCAGADLKALSEMMDAGVEEQMADADALGDLFLIFRRISTPIVAAVHGHAIAGGCGLASACDIIVASEDAKFGYPEVTIGFVPAMVIAMLRRAVGEKRAFDLVTTGRIIDASTAELYGLVQHVYPADEFDSSSRDSHSAASPLWLCASGCSIRRSSTRSKQRSVPAPTSTCLPA